jgi:hypothetical protein
VTDIVRLADKAGAPLTPGEADANAGELDRRTAVGWRDNIIEITLRNGPADAQFALFRDGIYLPSFVQSGVQNGYGNWHIDHDYKMGSALYLHIHWSANSALTGTVRWGFEYTLAKGHQQMAFGPTTTIYVEQAATGVQYMHYVAEVSEADAIPGTLIEPDTMILCRVFRDATHPNDTFDDQVFGVALDLHYEVAQASTPFKRPNFFTGP